MSNFDPVNSFEYAEGMFTTVIGRSTEEHTIILEPNLIKLPDGNGMMMSWTKGGSFEPDDANVTAYRRSYDGGRTWDEAKILFSHSTKGLYTPELSVAGGKIFAFPSTYAGTRDYERDFTSFISTSEDGGETFTTPRSIKGCFANFRVKDTLELDDRILFSGSWMETVGDYWAPRVGRKECIVAGKVYEHSEKELWQDSVKNIVGVLVADKNGNILRECGYMESEETSGLCEPMLTELSDGTLVCLMRCNFVREHFISYSYDRGETWTVPERSGIPSAISKTIVLRGKNGYHYMLLNADARGYRSPLSLWVSRDDMKTWEIKIDLIKAKEEPKHLVYPVPYREVGWSCCYPDGFIDEENGTLCFGWDDRHNVYFSEYKLPKKLL